MRTPNQISREPSSRRDATMVAFVPPKETFPMSRLLLTGSIVLALVLTTRAADEKPAPPGKTRADEPVAKTVSPEKGARYLDAVASDWTTKHKCGTCHTNVPYLMARPAVAGKTSSEETAVRTFF